jgi:hypothetical protein
VNNCQHCRHQSSISPLPDRRSAMASATGIVEGMSQYPQRPQSPRACVCSIIQIGSLCDEGRHEYLNNPTKSVRARCLPPRRRAVRPGRTYRSRQGSCCPGAKGDRAGAVYCVHHRPHGPRPNGVAPRYRSCGEGTWTAATMSCLRQRLELSRASRNVTSSEECSRAPGWA